MFKHIYHTILPYHSILWIIKKLSGLTLSCRTARLWQNPHSARLWQLVRFNWADWRFPADLVCQPTWYLPCSRTPKAKLVSSSLNPHSLSGDVLSPQWEQECTSDSPFAPIEDSHRSLRPRSPADQQAYTMVLLPVQTHQVPIAHSKHRLSFVDLWLPYYVWIVSTLAEKGSFVKHRHVINTIEWTTINSHDTMTKPL